MQLGWVDKKRAGSMDCICKTEREMPPREIYVRLANPWQNYLLIV